jgi:hypothetical protein
MPVRDRRDIAGATLFLVTERTDPREIAEHARRTIADLAGIEAKVAEAHGKEIGGVAAARGEGAKGQRIHADVLRHSLDLPHSAAFELDDGAIRLPMAKQGFEPAGRPSVSWVAHLDFS